MLLIIFKCSRWKKFVMKKSIPWVLDIIKNNCKWLKQFTSPLIWTATMQRGKKLFHFNISCLTYQQQEKLLAYCDTHPKFAKCAKFDKNLCNLGKEQTTLIIAQSIHFVMSSVKTDGWNPLEKALHVCLFSCCIAEIYRPLPKGKLHFSVRLSCTAWCKL